MKTLEQLNEELDTPIPRSAVSQRQGGGGRSLSYLAGHYVIDRLNKVFGPLNWASKTEMLNMVHQSETSVHYIAQVRLVVEGPDGKKTEHTSTGYGDGSDKVNIGKAHELAVKEAETDALKRCAKNLGMSMGLALYSKDQENVVDDSQPAPKSAAPLPAPRQVNPPASRPVVKDAHADRKKLNDRLAATAKVVNSLGKRTFEQIKEDMRSKYGTEKKEDLSDAQAEELLGSLSALTSA